MQPVPWLIEKKREGQNLSEKEICELVEGYGAGTVSEAQMAAFAMAVYFQGMSLEETACLTQAMLESGQTLDFSDLPWPTADKHSTGGVGDKISLALAPLAAACGVAVPMISGRGLGITGGTLDKLESIPGYQTGLDVKKFREVLSETRCSIIGQTPELAPVDKRLYALRDVTATVPATPLIVSSILSKKLAEGAQALVLDVKCGSGAFKKNQEAGRELAEKLVAIGTRMGRRMWACLTDMSQPLGRAVGNALEVREIVEILHNGGPADSRELTLQLTARMVCLSRAEMPLDAAIKQCENALADGAALQAFKAMIRAHGGDDAIVENPDLLPRAEHIEAVEAPESGYVAKADAEQLGQAAFVLGVGRNQPEDAVRFETGLTGLKKVGEKVEAGEPLCYLHGADTKMRDAAREKVLSAYAVSVEPVSPAPLILDEIK